MSELDEDYGEEEYAEEGYSEEDFVGEPALLEGVLRNLTKGIRKRWEPRWVMVTPVELLLFKGKRRPKENQKPKAVFSLPYTLVEEVAQSAKHYRPFAFKLTLVDDDNNPQEEMLLAANNEDEYNEWLTEIVGRSASAPEDEEGGDFGMLGGGAVDVRAFREGEDPTAAALGLPGESRAGVQVDGANGSSRELGGAASSAVSEDTSLTGVRGGARAGGTPPSEGGPPSGPPPESDESELGSATAYGQSYADSSARSSRKAKSALFAPADTSYGAGRGSARNSLPMTPSLKRSRMFAQLGMGPSATPGSPRLAPAAARAATADDPGAAARRAQQQQAQAAINAALAAVADAQGGAPSRLTGTSKVRTQPATISQALAAFDSATEYSNGELPLPKLPALARELGTPLAPGYLQTPEAARELDPDGDGEVSREAFSAWFRGQQRKATLAMQAEEAVSGAAAAIDRLNAMSATPAAPSAAAPPPPPPARAPHESKDDPAEKEDKAAAPSFQIPASPAPKRPFLVPYSETDVRRAASKASAAMAHVGPAPSTPGPRGESVQDLSATGGSFFGAAATGGSATGFRSTKRAVLSATGKRGGAGGVTLASVLAGSSEGGDTMSGKASTGTAATAVADDTEHIPLPLPPPSPIAAFGGMRVSSGDAPPEFGLGLGFELGSPDELRKEEAREWVSIDREAARRSRDPLAGDDSARSGGAWLPNGKRAPGAATRAGDGPDSGDAPNTGGIAREVLHHEFDEEEWNERYQRLLEWPERTFAGAVERGIAVSAFMGKFESVAMEAVRLIVDEQAIPTRLKSLPPVSMEGGGDEQVYFFKGLLLRVAVGGGAADARLAEEAGTDSVGIGGIGAGGWLPIKPHGEDITARRIAGHELRGLQCVQRASEQLYREWLHSVGAADAASASTRRPPPLCTILSCVVDYCGFRVNALCIPPMDQDRTLVYGALDESSGFVQRDPSLTSMLRRVGRYLNLRSHSVETTIEGEEDPRTGERSRTAATIQVALSTNVQGHHCSDGRYYLMNLAHLFPADLPTPGTPELHTNLLRPELLAQQPGPLSADAFFPAVGHPSDRADNDLAVSMVSRDLVDRVIPEFVAKLDSLQLMPCDSGAITNALHTAGINARHLGRIANGSTMPHVREMAEVEMVARAAKHIIGRKMRAVIQRIAASTAVDDGADDFRDGDDATGAAVHAARSYSLVVRRELAACAVDLYNLILGRSVAALRFWVEVIGPSVESLFDYKLRWTPPAEATRGGAGGEDGDERAIGGDTAERFTHFVTESRATASHARAETSSTRRERRLPASIPWHKAQVMYALQYHTGLRFVDDEDYDMEREARPFRIGQLVPPAPVVCSMRRRGDIECGVLSASAEEFFARGEYDMAAQAYNLRVALLQCHGEGDGLEAAGALLDAGRVFVSQHRSFEVMQCVKAALAKVPPRHLLAARAHMLAMQASFQAGSAQAGLAAYDKAVVATQYHLGRHHPLTCELGCELSRCLAGIGRPEAAAAHLERARDLGVRVVGERHPIIAAYCSQLGHLYKACGMLEKSVRAHERALVLLDAAAQAAGTSHVAVPPALGASLEAALARSYFAVADVLALSGHVDKALTMATKASDMRSSRLAPHDSLLLRSYQQMAALLDRLDRPKDAIRYLEMVLAQLRLRRDDSAVESVQKGTCHVIRLSFRTLPVQHRAVLRKVVAANESAAEDPTVLHFVISRLFSSTPSAYVTQVMTQVLSGVHHGNPSPAAQIACIAFLSTGGDAPSGSSRLRSTAATAGRDRVYDSNLTGEARDGQAAVAFTF